MKKVLVIQNVTRERLGLLEALLIRHNIAWDVADPDAGDPFPDPMAYDALIVFGGPDSANDQTPKMLDEVDRVRTAVRAGKPFLGICLGMQVLARACGGRVFPHTLKELGWRGPDDEVFAVALTPEGRRDPLFAGLESPFLIFQLHGETVDPPPGMAVLATGAFCQNQVVRFGDKAYGIQGHFELTETMFREWLVEDDDLKTMDHTALLADYAAIKDNYERIGNRLFTNFLICAGLAD